MRKSSGPQNRRLTVIVVVVAAVQVAALFMYRWIERERHVPGDTRFQFEQLRPRLAPDITLLRPDGSTRRLAEMRGRVVLLHFWATWCLPCREELPQLLAFGRSPGRSGRFQVVAVSLDEDWKVVRTFFEGEIPSEVFRDARGTSNDAFELSTLPDTYLLGPDGSLQLRFHGTREWGSDAARVLESYEGEP